MSKLINLLGDYKVMCHEENGVLYKIKCQNIEAPNNVQEWGFTLANKWKQKPMMLTKYKMNVRTAAQNLAHKLQRQVTSSEMKLTCPYLGSGATTNFTKRKDVVLI